MASEDDLNFQFLAENSVDILCRTDTNAKMRYVSPSSLRILGWSPEEMIGNGPEVFVLAEDHPVLHTAIAHCNAPGVENTSVVIRYRRKSGPPVWMEVNARAVRDPATGEAQEHVIVMRDISERKLLEEKLAALALTDALTGLANRRAFDEALQREWKRTLREGGLISLLLLDIDHFKRFNDSYGHQAGDDCLRAVAAAVRGAVRATDIAARYGGEEIAVILPSTGAIGAVETAERIRSAVEALRIDLPASGGVECQVTVSVGAATALALNGGSVTMPESLIQAADNSLYKAKDGGRNRVESGLVIACPDVETPSHAF